MRKNKILITGSSGFLGSHIVDTLEGLGHDVTLFDSVPSPYKKSNQKEIIGNILSTDDIKKAVSDCDQIFHFAAQADIDPLSRSPKETIETNVIGTQNLLEAAVRNKCKRFIFASTIYVYSELGSFYRVSKQACEKIIEEYQRLYSLPYTILRFGSLYGPRANKFNAVQNFLLSAIKNKKIIRNGDGDELREYIHVKDASRLAVLATKSQYKNKHLIITGNQQIKVKNLLLMINEIFNGEIEIEYQVSNEALHYEITPYNYKPQIAQKLTSDTFYDLGQGLLDLIYDIDLKYIKRKDKNHVTIEQINENS